MRKSVNLTLTLSLVRRGNKTLLAFILSFVCAASPSAGAAAGSGPSGQQNRSAAPDFSALLGDYVAAVAAVGTVPSPFGRFAATRIERRPDGMVVTFTRDDGAELPLSFAFPYHCVECVRAQLFAVTWPPDHPEGYALAHAIVDRSGALDVESARARLSSTPIDRLVGAFVPVAFRLDAIGVRLRGTLWHAASAVAAATGPGSRIWQGIWDNLETRGPWIHDASALFMPMLLWCLTVLFLTLETVHAVRRLDRRMRFALLGLVVASVILRRLVSSDGPGDLHVNLLMEDYGLTPAALLGLIGAFAPTSPATVIAVATVLGSLAPAYGSLLSYALHRDRATAISAGVLLSLQPILIRFSGDCERQSYVILLAVVALWSLAYYFASRRWTALAVHVLATVLCLNARPEGAFVLVFSLLLVWPGHRLSSASLAAVGAHAVTGVMLLLVSNRGRDIIEHGAGTAAVPGSALPGPGTTVWMSAEYTSVVVMALFVAGVVFALAKRERDGIWAVLSILVTTVVARGSVADGWIANARYQTLSLLPFTLLAATGLAHIGRIAASHWNEKAMRFSTAGAWCAIVLSTLPPLYRVNLPRTIDYEFRFLTEVLPRLAPDAVIYCAKDDESDLDMKKFQLVSKLLGLGRQRWLVWDGEPLLADRPAYFFVQPYCRVQPAEWQKRRLQDIAARPASDTLEAFNACREAARCSGAKVIAEAAVPARRFSMEEFAEGEVQLAMLEVSPAVCGAGATAP